MKIIKLQAMDAFATNCYIMVTDERNAVMIDCPKGAEKILDDLKEHGAVLKKILLTHGHCDHIEALAEVAEKTGADVYIHKFDAPKLTDSRGNLSEYFAAYLDAPVRHYDKAIPVSDGDIIKQDELEFKVMHTPGHTSGCVCYTVEDVMFSGDTLFRDSIGRTDMVDGDYRVLSESLKKLTEIETDYRIFAGHGDETTLSREKNHNPYIGGNMFAF
ncbi:MAG: MBL fold metallo-hydrolase [Ruminococcus sp.]|nr:MBL fold metallo-hydrolase [Ruminococcus sp.]MCM1479359.1 MBL fold metallo-hydrolase [Muribaculaceae bacterium]